MKFQLEKKIIQNKQIKNRLKDKHENQKSLKNKKF